MASDITEVTTGGIAVAAFVRPSAAHEPVEQTLDRLDRLATAGVIDEFAVRAWPDEVPYPAERYGLEVVEAYEEFSEWADRADAAIEPAFDPGVARSLPTGETLELLSTPAFCLAVYEDGALVGVYPHSDESGHHPVSDGVEAVVDAAARRSPRGEDGDRCPECGADRVDVQGIDTCCECAWIDTGEAVPAVGEERVTRKLA